MKLNDFEITEYIGADTETNGLDTQRCKAFNIAFVNMLGQHFYIDFRTDPDGIADAQFILDNCIAVFHNAKFDIKMLENLGIRVPRFEDTMIMAFLINEYHGSLKLDYLAEKYLKENKLIDEKFAQWKKLNKKEIEANGFFSVPSEIIKPYTIQDSMLALKLFFLFRTGLQKLQQEEQYRFEKMFLRDIAEIERNGVQIDIETGFASLLKMKQEMSALEFDFKTVYQLENPNSWQQVLAIINRTHPGVTSTKKEVLLDLIDEELKFASDLFKYRQRKTLCSTFLFPILENVNKATRRVHTNFNTTRAKTSRLSSSDPINFQNLPKPGDEENDIRNSVREIIVARPGHYLIGGDFDQEEMRIIADECNCTQLIELFNSNTEDIYVDVAKIIWPHEIINKQLRFASKQSTLGTSYGMGPNKFVKQAKRYGFDFEVAQAREVINTIKGRFPEIHEMLQHLSYKIRSIGWVADRFGKRYNVPQDFAYKAFNAVIQGTGAQIMKRGIRELSLDIKAVFGSNPIFRIVNTVHDEILCEVHKKILADDAWRMIQGAMERISRFFKVRIKMSRKDYDGNWARTIK